VGIGIQLSLRFAAYSQTFGDNGFRHGVDSRWQWHGYRGPDAISQSIIKPRCDKPQHHRYSITYRSIFGSQWILL
jgi:hypothetical protein